MVLEFVVLYNLAFLKRVFPKGQFPKQRIYTNCSFSLGSVSRRRRHSIQVLKRWTAATLSHAPQPTLWLFLRSFHFPLVFHVFTSSPWPQHKLTTWELSIFFSYPVIFVCGCSLCWMILTCWMIIVSRIVCYYPQIHTHIYKAFYFSLNIAKK